MIFGYLGLKIASAKQKGDPQGSIRVPKSAPMRPSDTARDQKSPKDDAWGLPEDEFLAQTDAREPPEVDFERPQGDYLAQDDAREPPEGDFEPPDGDFVAQDGAREPPEPH